ncbi:MAG: hypothetical protein SVZ03_08150 [Spirochaetota bacterium]|nr:hypothetical protein [Spirochaetota bacterium]
MDNSLIKMMNVYIPQIDIWIGEILKKYHNQKISVLDFNFPRLPLFYSKQLLKSTNVIILNEDLPLPPLLHELSGFAEFFTGYIAGITYKDTYFIRTDFSSDESLHFHELIHVLQWDILGVEKNLTYYAMGLLEKGYRGSFLEDMAFRHQSRFDQNDDPYNVEDEVINEINHYIEKLQSPNDE